MSRISSDLVKFITRFMAVGFAVRLLSALLLSGTDPRLAMLFLQHAVAAGTIFVLLRVGRFEWGIVFMGFEFALLSIRLVWLFGTAPLFHIHALVLAPVALLFTHYSKRKRLVFISLPMVLTMLVAMIPRHHDPTFPLSSNATEIWSLVNLALFMSACMGIILYQIHSLEEQTGKAEALARQRSRLIADLSHEWKTPLAAILAKVQATLTRPREADEYKGALELCERNARHLRSMTERMVSYQQAEQGHLTPQKEPTSLRPLLENLIQDLRPLAEEKGFTLNLDVPEEFTMDTDPLLLQLLLRNLVGNAVQHAAGGDSIGIHVHTDPQFVIRIEDNGPGILPDQLADIFDPFVRGSSARTREGGSVGLGLSIARETATSLGLKLTAQNRPEGGACFQLERA